MRRIAVVAAVILLSVVAGTTAFNARDRIAPAGVSAAVPTPTRTPTPKPGVVPTPTRAPIPPPVVPAPATKLDAIPMGCSSATPGGARVLFLWGPSKAGAQWLDLSIDNNGFAPGDFASRGAFDPNTWGFMWDGLIQGMTSYVRINTLTAQGWMTSETVSFFTPICDQAYYDTAPGADMLALRDRIAGAIGGSGIDTAVAITDLRTHATIDVNGAQDRLPGCTINLFALMRTVEDLQFGRYPEPPAGDLVSRTIYSSNPITSRDLVINYVGGGDEATGVHDVNDFVHSLGMSSTLMDHPPAYPWESFYGLGDNRITALDVNRGLQALWDGRVLLPYWRDYLLQKMTGVKPGLNYLIPAGVGYGATVSHKNGFLYSEGWADNDIGIVWFQRGGQRYGYAISFYTQGVASKYADIGLGQRISSLAYQWFVGRYGYP